MASRPAAVSARPWSATACAAACGRSCGDSTPTSSRAGTSCSWPAPPAATASQAELDRHSTASCAPPACSADDTTGTNVKRLGIGADPPLPSAVLLAAVALPLRAQLLALHRAGDRAATACSRAAGWAPSASRAATRGIPEAMTLSAERLAARVGRSRRAGSSACSAIAVASGWRCSVRCLRSGAESPSPSADAAPAPRRPHPAAPSAQPPTPLGRADARSRSPPSARPVPTPGADRQPVPAPDAAADDPARPAERRATPQPHALCPAQSQRRPGRPAGLAVQPDLPDPVPGADASSTPSSATSASRSSC